MKFTPYSFSKISLYQQCPQKFQYKYIDKVKVPFVYSEALIKGGCVHSILEHHPNLSPHKRREKYQHVADQFLQTDLGREIFSYQRHNEIDFGLTKQLEPCEYRDKEALFRGSVDSMFVQHKEDGSVNKMVLIDFKTGALRDEKYMNYDQLSWYTIYFFKKYPKLETIEISYVYVEHENVHKSKTFQRSDLNNLTVSLLKNITAIEVDSVFETSESALCSYCDFQGICAPVVKTLQFDNSFDF